MHRLRLFALLTTIPSIVGVVLLAEGDDFSTALLWLLTPALVAGAVLSPRFHPLDRVTPHGIARLKAAWKSTLADIGWIALGYLVALLGGAVLGQLVDPDIGALGRAVVLALSCGGAVLTGTALGLVVVLPVYSLVEQAKIGTKPGSINRGAIAGAFLLLSLLVLVISFVAGTRVTSGGGPRGRGFTSFFVAITGIHADDAYITSEPLAWVARIALVGLIVSGIALYRLSRGHRGQNG